MTISAQKNKNHAGFTLIEMMVATAIFLAVAVISISTVLVTNRAYNKGDDMRTIIDNLDFAMQDMSHNLRFGYNYSAQNRDTIQYVPNTVAFASTDGTLPTSPTEGYSFTDNALFKIDSQGNSIQLTDPRIIVDPDKSGFFVHTITPDGTLLQPYVTIVLSGTITTKKGAKDETVTPFKLQTSVTQRILSN